MKKDLADLRLKETSELLVLVKGLQDDVKKTVSEIFEGKSKDLSKVGKLRRQVARIKTVIKEKETNA